VALFYSLVPFRTDSDCGALDLNRSGRPRSSGTDSVKSSIQSVRSRSNDEDLNEEGRGYLGFVVLAGDEVCG
jgi:hypothetical protein